MDVKFKKNKRMHDVRGLLSAFQNSMKDVADVCAVI